MSDPKDFFKGRIGNSEDMGQAEKDLWIQIEDALNELLDELKTKDKIRTSFDSVEIDHIKNMMDNINQLSWNNYLLFNLFDKDKAEAFLQAVSKFGFDEFRVVSLYIQQSIFYSISCIELFKTLLLFHLKDVDIKRSFNKIIEDEAPNAWKKLKPFVDNKFRNSFAHGTWAVENKEIILFQNAKLERYNEPYNNNLKLAEFINKTREQNLVYFCAYYVFNEKWKIGFFTSIE